MAFKAPAHGWFFSSVSFFLNQGGILGLSDKDAPEAPRGVSGAMHFKRGRRSVPVQRVLGACEKNRKKSESGVST